MLTAGAVQRPITLVFSMILTAVLAACSEDAGNGDAATTPRPDATLAADAAPAADATAEDAATEDAAAADALVADADAPDAIAADAEPLDSGVEDAAAEDAATSPDAGQTCGMIGQACDEQEGCGAGNLECNLIHNVCLPAMPHCGGFAQTMCPQATPICMYFDGADYGPCFTVFERTCACATPRGRAALVGCP